jgi:hypothetical protein
MANGALAFLAGLTGGLGRRAAETRARRERGGGFDEWLRRFNIQREARLEEAQLGRVQGLLGEERRFERQKELATFAQGLTQQAEAQKREQMMGLMAQLGLTVPGAAPTAAPTGAPTDPVLGAIDRAQADPGVAALGERSRGLFGAEGPPGAAGVPAPTAPTAPGAPVDPQAALALLRDDPALAGVIQAKAAKGRAAAQKAAEQFAGPEQLPPTFGEQMQAWQRRVAGLKSRERLAEISAQRATDAFLATPQTVTRQLGLFQPAIQEQNPALQEAQDAMKQANQALRQARGLRVAVEGEEPTEEAAAAARTEAREKRKTAISTFVEAFGDQPREVAKLQLARAKGALGIDKPDVTTQLSALTKTLDTLGPGGLLVLLQDKKRLKQLLDQLGMSEADFRRYAQGILPQ